MATMGQRIKEERARLGIIQEELGKKCGVTKYTISLYEHDKSTPSDEIKKIMANLFEVTIDYLLGVTDIRNAEMQNKLNNPTLTRKDEKDIEKVFNEIDNNLDTYQLNGDPLNEEDRISLRRFMRSMIVDMKLEAKKKYNPNKNKKQE